MTIYSRVDVSSVGRCIARTPNETGGSDCGRWRNAKVAPRAVVRLLADPKLNSPPAKRGDFTRSHGGSLPHPFVGPSSTMRMPSQEELSSRGRSRGEYTPSQNQGAQMGLSAGRCGGFSRLPLTRRLRKSAATISSIAASSRSKSPPAAMSMRPPSLSKRPAPISTLKSGGKGRRNVDPAAEELRDIGRISAPFVTGELKFGHCGSHQTGVHGEGKHSAVSQRVRNAFGETQQSGLTRRVARAVWKRSSCSAADHVHKSSALAREHPGNCGPAAIESSAHVDLDVAPPGFRSTIQIGPKAVKEPALLASKLTGPRSRSIAANTVSTASRSTMSVA